MLAAAGMMALGAILWVLVKPWSTCFVLSCSAQWPLVCGLQMSKEWLTGKESGEHTVAPPCPAYKHGCSLLQMTWPSCRYKQTCASIMHRHELCQLDTCIICLCDALSYNESIRSSLPQMLSPAHECVRRPPVSWRVTRSACYAV